VQAVLVFLVQPVQQQAPVADLVVVHLHLDTLQSVAVAVEVAVNFFKAVLDTLIIDKV
jgi:hypothetical protein